MIFHDGEHKINNTEWIWNGDERERWNEAKPKGNADRFSNLHFLDQKWSKDLEFCTCKTERTLQISGKCVQFTQSCLRTPLLNLHTKQSRKINAMGRVVFLKRAQLCLDIKYGEVSLRYEFATLPPKTTTSLWDEMKGKTRKIQSD